MIEGDQERLSEEARRLLGSDTFQAMIDRLKDRFMAEARRMDPYDPLVPKLLTKLQLIDEVVDDLRHEAAQWKVSVHNARAKANAELRVTKN